MIRRIAAGLVFAVCLLVTGCNDTKESVYQGWIEADLIFVGPDEAGRIAQLSVREGDQVALRAPLFNVDADLQQADVAMQEASVKNAQQAYDRAVALMRTNAGTQKTLEDAEAALRTAQARLNSAQTRLTRRRRSARPPAPSSKSISRREIVRQAAR
jgi:HlyD family secretion protein